MGINYWDPNGRIVTADGFLKEAEWQHIVFTYDNGTGTLYRNGVARATLTGMPTPQPWQGLMVGGGYGNLPFNGNVADLRVYQRVLSATEASQLYLCPPGALPALPACTTPALQLSPNTTLAAGQSTTLRAQAQQAALQFDGVADEVSVASNGSTPSPVLANVVNTFTVEAWVKPSAPHEIDQQQTDGIAGVYNQRYLIFPQYGDDAWGAGHAGMGISVGTNGVSVYEHAKDYLPPLLVWQGTLTGWTHVAVVYQNRRPSLFINGRLVAQGLQSARAYVHPSAGFGGGFYGYFQGQADEIRIWNEDRSAQLQTQYQQGVTLPASTLMGEWHLDEGQGRTATDASGNQLTGTLTRGTVLDGNRNVVAPPPGPGPQWQVPSGAPLPAGVALAYSWSPAAGLDRTTGATVRANPTVTTTYTVTATSGTGCSPTQGTVTVTVPALAGPALPPNNPSADLDRNWTLERSFDGDGNVVAESKQFTDALGRPTQAQARNAATQQVFAAQTVYNTGGQAVLQTLAAPINNQGFSYKEGFITAGGAAYGPANFEQSKASAPDAVDATTPGTLGYYFSQQNSQEPLTPITSYPYSLVEPYDGPLGGTKRAAGPGDELRMGKGRESKGREFPVRREFDNYLQLRPYFVPGSPLTTLEYQAIKSVSSNADGRESIVVSNKEGQALVTCLSGPQYAAQSVAGYLSAEATNAYDPNAPAYQDIHLPAAGAQAVTFTGGGSVRILNLLTEESYDYPVTSATTAVTPASGCYAYQVSATETAVTLAPGFYRLVSLSGTQRMAYAAHYGNYSYTYYDDAGRVVATVAPNGVVGNTALPSFTTRNTYDTSGRLLATESSDEGRSEYAYARDGRIRFSQSALQRPAGRFSYSNYDEAGRVVESGEYTPAQPPSPPTAPLPDQLTPLAAQPYQSAQYPGWEAETNAVVVSGCCVAYLNSVGNYAQFKISVPRAGAYDLKFNYAAGSPNSRMTLVVNGSANGPVDFPQTDNHIWGVYTLKTVATFLQAGINSVRLEFRATDTGGVNIVSFPV